VQAEQAKKTTTKTVKKAPPKKTAVKANTGTKRQPATAKNSIVKPSPAAKGSKKTGSKKSAPARRTPTRAAGQGIPTPDRYKDIQSALAERGFLKSEPNGQWGPESQDALKKFQQEQNLKVTGKLDSLSLISLGLGPKRTASALPRPLPTDGINNENRSTEGNQRP
jgi:peptidoglycan hydrolase-like protein with peptidoglycan-binding domain